MAKKLPNRFGWDDGDEIRIVNGDGIIERDHPRPKNVDFITAQRGSVSFLVSRGELGCVVDLGLGRGFDAMYRHAILARGYWKAVTASEEDQKRALKMAKPTLDAGPPMGSSLRLKPGSYS